MVKHYLRESSELVQLIFTNSNCKNDESLSHVLQDNDYVNIQDKLKRTPLHAAAFKNSVHFTQHLLERGARINSKDIHWHTPLHLAANYGSIDVVKMLLLNGADRFSRDIQWKMPLHLACGNNQLEVVKVLLSDLSTYAEVPEKNRSKNINASDKNGRTALHHAVNADNLEIVKYLVENKASVNALDKEDRRPLHWAASIGSCKLITFLIENDAEINCRDKKLFTPLHVAVAIGDVSVVEMLLNKGADLNALTLQGNTVFHLACLNGHADVLEILFKCFTKKLKLLPQGNSSNDQEIGENSPEDQHFLNTESTSDDISLDAVINIVRTTNFLGQTCIHIASSSEMGYTCLEYIINLIKASSQNSGEDESQLDLNIQTTRDGFTSLHLAAYFGRFEVGKLLVNNNANVNSTDYYSSSPIHIACTKGRDQFVQFLLNCGARWDSIDILGDSPLHIAAMNGSPICLGRLLKAASDEYAIDRFSTASSTSNTEEDEEFSVTPEGKILNERPDCGDYLLKKHLKKIVNMTDAKGRNLVHASVIGLDIECLKISLIHGGDLNLKDCDGRTPLHLCAISCVLSPEYLSNIDSVLLADSDLDFSSKRQQKISQTSTNPMAINHAFNIAEALLRLGAEVNQTDKYGLTVFHFASALDYSGNLMALLKEHKAQILVPGLWSTSRRDLDADKSKPSLRKFTIFKPQGTKGSSDMDNDEDDEVSVQARNINQRIGDGYEYFYPLHFATVTGNHVGIEIILESLSPDLILNVVVNAIHIVNPTTFFSENRIFVQLKKVTSNVLFIACQKGHLQTLETLISISEQALSLLSGKEEYSELLEHYSQRSIGSVTDSLGRTLLHVAASAGNLEICRYLLENFVTFGVDICAKDEIFRWNALHHAASQGHVPVVNLLLKWHNNNLLQHQSNPRDNRVDDDRDKEETLDPAINSAMFIDPNAPMEDFKTNCTEGNSNIQTVTSPFLVDVGDEHMRTPLILAAQNNHTGTIELLLAPRAMGAQDKSQTYANISVQKWIELRSNAVDVYLRSALHRTVVNGHLDCFTILLKRGANIHARDFRDRHSLHMIATIGNVTMLSRLTQTIQKIISQITDSDLSVSDPYLLDQMHPLDKDSFSPLHYAIYKNNLDCVKFLISLPEYNSSQRGSDFNIIHCASQSGNAYCLEECFKIQFIKEIFYQPEMSSLTSLHLACQSNHFRCVTHLLKYEETMSKRNCPLKSSNNDDDDNNNDYGVFLIGKLASIADSLGRTPIMTAAMTGSTSCLEKLLTFHQRISILQTMQPRRINGKPNGGIICLSKRLALDCPDENGMTVLHHACTHTQDYAGLLILEKMEGNEIINKRDQDNRTPAHLSIQSGLPNLLDALIQRGANLYAVDQHGRIPALSSAQNPKVAECLSLCLAAMFPSIQTTKKCTLPKDPVISAEETEEVDVVNTAWKLNGDQTAGNNNMNENSAAIKVSHGDLVDIDLANMLDTEDAELIADSPVKIISSDPDSDDDEFF